jgi:predicted Ser/Thr protein kinase
VLNNTKVEFSELTQMEEIARGSFAIVYKCQWKGRAAACKQARFDHDFGFSL